MNHITQTATRSRPRAGLAVLAAAISMFALAPAASHAAKANFGADLSGPVSPVASPETCANASKGCTRMPILYSNPAHAGMTPFAPEDGKIKKIKLVASSPGKLRIMLADHDYLSKGKVTHRGPKIKYKGTGSVEKFKVKIPVKQYEFLAFKTKKAKTLQCEGGMDNELLFQPNLKVGGPLTGASSATDCTHLIGARMKY